MSVSAKSDNALSRTWTPDAGLEQEPIEEVKLASARDDSTFDEIRASLNGKDVSTERIRPSDVYEEEGELFIGDTEASEFEGTIFYRPNTWFGDLSEDERMEKMGLMARIEKEKDVDFFGGAQSALLSRDKKTTKRVFESHGVDTVEDYDLEEAEDLLEGGENVVAKPRNGTCQGESVELLESSSDLERYVNEKVGDLGEVEDKVLFEEYMPTGNENENHDMRMIIAGDKIYRKERVNGDGIANNLDNNGEYKEAPLMNREELELASKSKEIFGEGFYAVDYIRTDDGKVKVLENNATPGTKIEDEIDADLKEDVSEAIYQNETGPRVGGQGYAERAPVL